MLYYCSARCGAGKTTHFAKRMGQEQGRWLLAVDRIEVIEDRMHMIAKAADVAGMAEPTMLAIHSKNDDPDRRRDIRQRIEAAFQELSALDHAVLVVTHAGLLASDAATFCQSAASWKLVIDERPTVLQSHHFEKNPLAPATLNHCFGIDPLRGATWVKSGIDGKLFRNAQNKTWAELHDLVKTGEATATICDWAEAANQDWSIYRAWDMTVLDEFEDSFILADMFDETDTFKLLSHHGRAPQAYQLQDHRTWGDRHVMIQYFAADHKASAYRFDQREMKPLLRSIGKFVDQTTEPMIVTTNDKFSKTFSVSAGIKLPPMQAGSNAYSHIDCATILYTARPSDAEQSLMRRFSVSEADLVTSRERYAIKQFVMRTSLRDPLSTRPVTLRVYDRFQAEDVGKYLVNSYGYTVDIQHVDLRVNRPTASPKKAAPAKTEEERKEYNRAKQAESRARQKANKLATGQPPAQRGRPRKSMQGTTLSM